MKRTSTLFNLLILTMGTFAQSAIPSNKLPKATPTKDPGTTERDQVTSGSAKSGGDVIFYEDFANGLAGNNGGIGMGPWTLTGPNGNIWSYKHSGPVGAYTDATEIIASPTASNGFMVFQSDSANSDWTQNPPVIVANPVDWNGGLVSPTIDLSATPYVEITFSTRFRYCCNESPFYVEVSTDGGSTWPGRFEVSGGVATNTGSGTVTRRVNITQAITGNPSNVKFRFYHDGTESESSHYHWQVDDVYIKELYDYDPKMVSAAQTTWDNSTAMTYDSLLYTIFPFGQLRPLGLNMTVLNNGAMDQSGVASANFKVQQQGGPVVLDQDQTITNFPAGATRTVFVNPDFTPPAVAGLYNITYSVNTTDPDVDLTNNSTTGSFRVSQYTYARDANAYSTTNFEDGDGTGAEFILCNAFHVYSDATLYAISVALGTGTTTGSVVRAHVRDGLDNGVELATTMEHDIISSELNGNNGSKFINMVFANPFAVTAGTDYFVCVEHLGGSTMRMGLSGTSFPQTSFIFYDGSNGLDWYYTTRTPMIRMSFDPTVGIEEGDRQNGVGLGQNVPNPASSTTLIPYELTSAAPVMVRLHDISGKLMLESNEGTQAPGAHRVELDTRTLAEGVYSYTLSAGDVHLTKRMVVVH